MFITMAVVVDQRLATSKVRLLLVKMTVSLLLVNLMSIPDNKPHIF